jgi:hypothetical protein
MDLSKFRPADWLMVAGGAAFLVFGTFVDWIKFSFGGESTTDGNAFDFFFTGTVPWLLIIGVGVIAFLLAAGVIKAGSTPWPLILLAMSALGTLLVLIRLAVPDIGEDIPEGFDDISIGRGIGLIASGIAGIVSTAGAFMNFTASGGTLKDLTDPGKLKDRFGGG